MLEIHLCPGTSRKKQAGVGLHRVINVTLPEWVTVRKILARRHCSGCGKGFNVANVDEGESLDLTLFSPRGGGGVTVAGFR